MIYFIRHSQVGPRGNYDELSELGIRQAHHLGDYFAHQQIKFDKLYVGNLARQQLTASIASSHLPNQAELITDEHWNEFRLDPVYRTIAAKLSLEDEIFAQDFTAMQSMLSEDAEAMRGAVARCDRAVMQAEKKTLELAWIVQNSSLTTMKLRDDALHLYSFNATSHLTNEALPTFR